MKPTKLYIKIHTQTGLLYFGKTVKDPYSYLGSGKRWINHINKHGREFVETIWVSELYLDEESIKRDALYISKELGVGTDKIVFANLIPENGINGGGDCSQMHTVEVRYKAKQAYIEKYGGLGFAVRHIREKAENTCLERHNKTIAQLVNSDNSISKRNNTNLTLHGSKCAANKNGNINSRITQKNKLNRLIVKQLKCVSAISSNKYPRGWYYKSDEELKNLLKYSLDTYKKSVSTDIRDLRLNSKRVLVLRMVNSLVALKLGRNWFQKPESYIDIIYNSVSRAHPVEFDIALQSYCLIFEE